VVLDFKGDDVPRKILSALYDMKVQSVIIEGGSRTHQMFINAGLWDEARVFIAPVMLGNGTRAAVLSGGRVVETLNVGDNVYEMMWYEPSGSSACSIDVKSNS
jgi:diaminohydroxyphosphoribosylaminopyrimidine deaminase/5-amino-6-(5-phosphoribosylamino)uracil reductase